MDKLEQIAEQIHEGWRTYQTGCGRVFGALRTETTHPHMVPWTELDNESQNQDRFVAACVLDDWCRGRLVVDELPRAIHEAWRRWVILQGRTHGHAKSFEVAHADGAEEHVLQARRIEPILRATTRVED